VEDNENMPHDPQREELGRRILAAVVSVQQGYTLQTAYQKVKDGPVGEAWQLVGDEALKVYVAMLDRLDRKMNASTPPGGRVH
jgi:hypothetical protein